MWQFENLEMLFPVFHFQIATFSNFQIISAALRVLCVSAVTLCIGIILNFDFWILTLSEEYLIHVLQQ